jgi:hypothetical protein
VEFRGFSFRNRTGKSSARIGAEIERLFQTCVEQLNVGTTGSGHPTAPAAMSVPRRSATSKLRPLQFLPSDARLGLIAVA